MASRPGGAVGRCARCLAERPAYDRVLAPYLYEPPLDAVIRQLKFGGLRYLGGQAATAILEHHTAALDAVDLVVPVPLHWGRRLRRGYDQAQEISRPLARRLGRPHRRALRRRRRTGPQAERSRDARRRLSAEVFAVVQGREVADRHVLLVDDVVTTGATAGAAAASLRRAGAARVTVAALARTPPPWSRGSGDWQGS
jgi:ComF family protein